MRCVLLCMMEAVEGGLSLMEETKVPEELEAINAPRVRGFENLQFSRYSPPPKDLADRQLPSQITTSSR